MMQEPQNSKEDDDIEKQQNTGPKDEEEGEYYEEGEEYADEEDEGEYDEEEEQEHLDEPLQVEPSGLPPVQNFISEIPNAATEYETINDVNFATNSGLIRRDHDMDEYRIYEEIRRRKHLQRQ